MVQQPLQIGVRPKVVAATLKGLRRHRRLSVLAVANAMGMPKRTYLYFEAGAGKLNIEHLILFAEVTQCDLAGLIAAILLETPPLAVRCADNKLMTTLVLAAMDFNDVVGANVALLTNADLHGRFKAMFRTLAAAAEVAESQAQPHWRRGVWTSLQQTAGETPGDEPSED